MPILETAAVGTAISSAIGGLAGLLGRGKKLTPAQERAYIGVQARAGDPLAKWFLTRIGQTTPPVVTPPPIDEPELPELPELPGDDLPEDQEEELDDFDLPPGGFEYPDEAYSDLPPFPGELTAATGQVLRFPKTKPTPKKGAKAPEAERTKILEEAGTIGRAARGSIAVILGQKALEYAAEKIVEPYEAAARESAERAKNADKALRARQKEIAKAERELRKESTAERRHQERLAEMRKSREAAEARELRRRTEKTDRELKEARARQGAFKKRWESTSRRVDRELKAARQAATKSARVPGAMPRAPINWGQVLQVAGQLAQGVLLGRRTSSRTQLFLPSAPPSSSPTPSPGAPSPSVGSIVNYFTSSSPGLAPAAQQAAERCYQVCRSTKPRRKRKKTTRKICYERKL